MSVIKLPKGDGTWEALRIPNIEAAITPEHDTYTTFNIGFDNTTIWKSITTPFTYKPADMTQNTGNIPIYMPYEGSINTGIQVVYGTVATDIGKIWMRRCDAGTWGSWALVAGEEMEKAAGTDINTGTDDAKFVTSKAIEDSNLIRSTDNSVTDIMYVTKAEYDAMTAEEKANKTIMVDEFSAGMAIYDAMPIGSIINYTGGTVPNGWTQKSYDYMTIGRLANDLTWTAVDSPTRVSFSDIVESSGTGLTKSGNTIVIGSGISRVRVTSGTLVDTSSPSASKYIFAYIYKNATAVSKNFSGLANNWTSVSSSAVVSVEEGDTISLYIQSNFSGNLYIYGYPVFGNATTTPNFLTVEAIG